MQVLKSDFGLMLLFLQENLPSLANVQRSAWEVGMSAAISTVLLLVPGFDSFGDVPSKDMPPSALGGSLSSGLGH